MTYDELIETLTERKALIVHCSRSGKTDEEKDALFFPEDLKRARGIFAGEGKDLCCSVIWPAHTETFGCVGIILRPRSVQSIAAIGTRDGGTYLDPKTGERVLSGVPFSAKAVMDTFANATDYNEWNVKDADTVGIFVKLDEPIMVTKLCDLKLHPDYHPAMGDVGLTPQTVIIHLSKVVETFPDLPVFGFCGTEIIQIGNGAISAATIYQAPCRSPESLAPRPGDAPRDYSRSRGLEDERGHFCRLPARLKCIAPLSSPLRQNLRGGRRSVHPNAAPARRIPRAL